MVSKKILKNKIKQALPFLTPVYRSFKYGIRIMRWVPTYDEDDLITNHICDFLHDERFMKSLATAKKEGHFQLGYVVRWRLYTACWAAEHAKNLDGDFVECGVAYGATSRTIMEYICFKNLNKKLYLLDTYEGLDDLYLSQDERLHLTEYKKTGGYPYTSAMYPFVKKAFGTFPNVIIVKGTVPDTLEQVKSDKVAYLHIDMNCTIPEIKAAEYFWPKMVPGAIMLLDDYGFAREQHDAFDKFARERGVNILSLPTGQGLIIKS